MEHLTRTNWVEVADGYSLGMYYECKRWQSIGDWIRCRKHPHYKTPYNKEEVREILLSEFMRWCADSYNFPTSNVPLAFFKQYFEKNEEMICKMLKDE